MRHFENLDDLLNSKSVADSIDTLDTFILEQSEYGKNIQGLTEEQSNFFYNQALEKEINNGGFDQYFFNETGQFAHETVESLMIIGAEKTADLLKRAIDVFPNGTVPKIRDERIKVMKQIESSTSEIWEKLDHEFYKYEEDLNSLNLYYVRQNRESF